MFRPEEGITHVPVTKEQVVGIVESINQPQVSIPGKSPQMVAGWLVGIRNANATFSIFVGLHLTKTGENVIYLDDAQRHVAMEAYRDLEVEGLHFLESMGFMLDNLNFRNLAVEAQDETMKRIPLFQPPRPPTAQAAGGASEKADASESAAVARFLASF